MVENFSFNSDSQPADKAFALYRSLYSGGADVSRGRGAFAADVRSWRLDRLILFDRTVSGIVHERLAPRVRDTGFSHFTVTLVKNGVLIGSAASGFDRVEPDHVVLQDMRKPGRIELEGVSLTTASVARDLIEAAVGSATGLQGRIIGPGEGGLLADYMRSLAARAPTLRSDARAPVSRAFVELLSLALTPMGGGARAGVAREDFARREAIQRFIEHNLQTPDLNTATIVSGTGVSRTTLYRLMSAHGGVARFIGDRRIERVRALLDEAGSDVTLGDLAEGLCLSSASRLSKKFRQTYGLSPSDYRRIIGDPDRTVDALRQRWAAWMVEIR